MACVHLRKLYQLCQEEGLLLASSDVVRFVCDKCGIKDVCPSTLVQFDEDEEEDHQAEGSESARGES